MLGLDVIDLVPADTVEEMLHSNAASIVAGLAGYVQGVEGLQPGEMVMLMVLPIPATETRPTRVLVRICAADSKGVPTRGLKQWDLHEVLATLPVAKLLRDAKRHSKEMDRATSELTKANKALQAAADKVQAVLDKGKEAPQKLLTELASAQLRTDKAAAAAEQLVKSSPLKQLAPAAPTPALPEHTAQ